MSQVNQVNESKILAAQISKCISTMNNFYNQIFIEKKNLLNNLKMIEYLFNKPIKKSNNLTFLTNFSRDYFVKRVKMDSNQRLDFENIFLTIYNYQHNYLKMFETYKKCIQKFSQCQGRKINLDNQLPYIPIPSIEKSKIADFLNKNLVVFASPWSFYLQENHQNAEETEPYNFNLRFRIDFYCYFFNSRSEMVQFAVEVCENVSLAYLLKQYYLCQMNIHLLCLNKYSNIEKELGSFIYKINHTENYTVVNEKKYNLENLTPSLKLSLETYLFSFYQEYNKNHILYLKLSKKAERIADIDADEEETQNLDYVGSLHNYGPAADLSVSISAQAYEKLTKTKTIFSTRKKKVQKFV